VTLTERDCFLKVPYPDALLLAACYSKTET
jgi:hypothetical protein